MDTTTLVGGILIGVVVGFLASYPVGFLRELGRDRRRVSLRGGPTNGSISRPRLMPRKRGSEVFLSSR